MNGTRACTDLDELRLLGLSRIPRCAGCSRFLALQRAQALACHVVSPLPAVPEHCTYQVCRPLADRWESLAR